MRRPLPTTSYDRGRGRRDLPLDTIRVRAPRSSRATHARGGRRLGDRVGKPMIGYGRCVSGPCFRIAMVAVTTRALPGWPIAVCVPHALDLLYRRGTVINTIEFYFSEETT
jgi:hypothetical protein